METDVILLVGTVQRRENVWDCLKHVVIGAENVYGFVPLTTSASIISNFAMDTPNVVTNHIFPCVIMRL